MEALKVLEHENCCLRMMTMNINIMKCFCEKEKVKYFFLFASYSTSGGRETGFEN